MEEEVNLVVQEIDSFIELFDHQGIHYNIFSSLPAVLKAIKSKETILDVNNREVVLSEKIGDHSYRFLTEDEPNLSYETSEALAATVEVVRNSHSWLDRTAREKGVETRQRKADDFASKMIDQINQVKSEENVSTFRDTVDALNRRGVPTPREGGKWHLSTLQSVLKRTRNLDKDSGRGSA